MKKYIFTLFSGAMLVAATAVAQPDATADASTMMAYSAAATTTLTHDATDTRVSREGKEAKNTKDIKTKKRKREKYFPATHGPRKHLYPKRSQRGNNDRRMYRDHSIANF